MAETVVTMPRLADTLVEGTLGEWLKQVGERIAEGEALAIVETDKVTTELPSPIAGIVLEHLIAAGETVPIETPIARIGAAATAERTDTGSDPPPLAAPAVSPLSFTVSLTAMRRSIASHMQQAFDTIPCGQTVIAADLTDVAAWRDATRAGFQARQRANLSFTVLFVYALARALARLRPQEPRDIGVAVAVDRGLIVPVVRAADTLTAGELARTIAALATRARDRSIAPADTRGALMTVTNVGSFGNLTAAPIVPLDQLGILAPGLVEPRPMLTMDGGIRPGWRCLLSLSYDRRRLDDFAADRLLRAITAELLDAPLVFLSGLSPTE
jgi:2-oxoglutarate dehydrogenase E2 component (dihydrolipoamide succinyltransferase)